MSVSLNDICVGSVLLILRLSLTLSPRLAWNSLLSSGQLQIHWNRLVLDSLMLGVSVCISMSDFDLAIVQSQLTVSSVLSTLNPHAESFPGVIALNPMLSLSCLWGHGPRLEAHTPSASGLPPGGDPSLNG